MKKLFSIFCAVLASATLLATPAVSKRQAAENLRPASAVTLKQGKTEFAKSPLRSSINAKGVKRAVADVVPDSMWAYYFVPNQFVCGTPSTGLGFVDYAQIVTPYAETVTFYNGYAVPMTPQWLVGGEEQASGEQSFTIEAGIPGGEFDLPTLHYDPQVLATSDTTALYFNDYEFGKAWTACYAKYGFVNDVLMAPAWLQSVTQCGYYSEYDQKYGSGWGLYGGGTLGTYHYGTALINPYLDPDTVITPAAGETPADTSLVYHYFDTIMSVINNDRTMYIAQVTVGVMSVTDFFADSTTALTMTILPFLNDSTIDWENPLGVGFATAGDYIDAGGWYGTLTFKFYDVDPLGMIQQVPVIADSSFVVLITGINQDGVDVGFITDGEEDAPPAQTYLPFTKDGKRILETLWLSPMNIVENFFAIWPEVVGIPEEIEVPLEGVEIPVTLPSNVWAEDMEISSDDWIEIEAVSETEGEGDDEEFLYAIDVTLTVEESDVEREGLIEIDALGRTYQIVVRQTNDAPSAIENAVKVVNDGKLYNVLGIEVDEDYKGVVIRNGEKFLQR